jgi:prevent-host-death family protein
MHTVGLFEAKQKLSELVERASSGEKIGITRRGKLSAFITPADQDIDLEEIFAGLEQIRQRTQRSGKKIDIRKMIEAGRV